MVLVEEGARTVVEEGAVAVVVKVAWGCWLILTVVAWAAVSTRSATKRPASPRMFD